MQEYLWGEKICFYFESYMFLLGSYGNNVSPESACSPLAFLPQLWGNPPCAGYSQWQVFLRLYFQMPQGHLHPASHTPRDKETARAQ